MKNKEYLKKELLIITLTSILYLILFIILNQLEYKQYMKNFNLKINAILTAINQEYPNITKEQMLILLNSTDNYENILSSYGYDLTNDDYLINNKLTYHNFAIYKTSLLLLAFFLSITFFLKSNFKTDKAIDKIIKSIEQINQKKYDLDLDELSEDKLSILK